MKREFGSALKEFLRNRDYANSSFDLNMLYKESKNWDSFLLEARGYGFTWSQIYFVKEIVERYNCDNQNLKWFLLHLQYQYEIGNLRTSLVTVKDDIDMWVDSDRPPFNIQEFLDDIPQIITNYKNLFGIENEPFTVSGDFIYINRIKKYENRFLELLDLRLNVPENRDFDLKDAVSFLNLNSDFPLDEKRVEIVEKALRRNFLIISGGPGTGKTTTVVTIIKALKYRGLCNIALAAPTGRAAKRMVESIDDPEIEAFTLHKLLGIIPNKSNPRYYSGRELPVDALIVDEASMVDIHMMYRLFDALAPSTKLILVGDKDQLPSVEAGALLGDFLFRYSEPNHRMHNSISILEKSFRSSERIMDVARVVISGNSKSIIGVIKNGSDDVELEDLPDIETTISNLFSKYKMEGKPFSCSVTRWSEVEKEIEKYFKLFNSFTILTPSKKGPYGTYSINSRLKRLFNPHFAQFYHGEPIMITKNDYVNGLFNGDRGVVFSFSNGQYAFFKGIDGYKVTSISKISDYETAYAGTVHKSQGSEFDSVCIIIPEGSEKMLTREILYTALTRAKKKVTILSMESEIITAVNKKIKRESGIREFLID